LKLQIFPAAQQKCPNMTLAVPGYTWCAGGALTNFPCKLRLKNFLRPGAAGAPTAPPGYAYGIHILELWCHRLPRRL